MIARIAPLMICRLKLAETFFTPSDSAWTRWVSPFVSLSCCADRSFLMRIWKFVYDSAPVSFPRPWITASVAPAAAVGEGSAVVQGRGSLTGSDSYTNFQMRMKKLSTTSQDTLTNSLTRTLGAQSLGIKNVSASFSRQILSGAILAICVSFALIALYVSVRYRWRFAVPILRTLGNDIPIMLGIYAISGREVSADTVAAILTILGYSIYDTIIVFDRVRENLKLMPKASIATVVNVSVSEVLKRSIVTSTITLLPIIGLFILGGSTGSASR